MIDQLDKREDAFMGRRRIDRDDFVCFVCERPNREHCRHCDGCP